MGKLLVAFAWLPCALSLGCGETLRLGERPDAGAPIADASDVSPPPPSSSRPTPPVSLEPLEPIAERGVTDARAAFDGERAMIVWSRPSTTEPLYEISAARYDADGTLLDPQPLRLGIGRHFGVAPRETGGFLVVWTDAGGEVVYRNVERDGTLVLPQRVIDAGAAGSDLGLDFVAYRLGFYLVRLRAEGYIEQSLAPAADGSLVCRDFCGVRVSAGDGRFVGGVRLAESALGLSVYVVRHRAGGTAAIERRAIHGGAPVELVRAQAQALADVVAGSQSTLLTWYADRNRLLGARLDSATDALLDAEPVELSEVGQTTSAGVASSAGFAIALSGSEPQAKLLPEEGGPATTLLQDILLSDTLDAVALGEDRALLVGRGWLDDTLAATLVSLAPAQAQSLEVPRSAHGSGSRDVELACAGDRCVAAWRSGGIRAWDAGLQDLQPVRMRALDRRTGALLGETVELERASSVCLATDGERHLLLTTELGSAYLRIHSRISQGEGWSEPTTVLAELTASCVPPVPSCTFDGTHYVVSYARPHHAAPRELRELRLARDGTFVEDRAVIDDEAIAPELDHTGCFEYPGGSVAPAAGGYVVAGYSLLTRMAAITVRPDRSTLVQQWAPAARYPYGYDHALVRRRVASLPSGTFGMLGPIEDDGARLWVTDEEGAFLRSDLVAAPSTLPWDARIFALQDRFVVAFAPLFAAPGSVPSGTPVFRSFDARGHAIGEEALFDRDVRIEALAPAGGRDIAVVYRADLEPGWPGIQAGELQARILSLHDELGPPE